MHLPASGLDVAMPEIEKSAQIFLNEAPLGRVQGIKPMRSLVFRSGSVRLNDFENKIIVSLI